MLATIALPAVLPVGFSDLFHINDLPQLLTASAVTLARSSHCSPARFNAFRARYYPACSSGVSHGGRHRAELLVRVILTRRHLLEWVPAAQIAEGLGTQSRQASYRRMVGAPVIGILTLITAYSVGETWLLAVPFAVLWIASPAVALWASLFP